MLLCKCVELSSRSNRAVFFMPATRNGLVTMNRDELTAIVKHNNADTLIAARMRDALGLQRQHHRTRGQWRDKSRKARRYRGAKKLMKQKHGVRL